MLKYQFHTKQELREALEAVKWSLHRDNPFRTKDPIRVRSMQAERDALQRLLLDRR